MSQTPSKPNRESPPNTPRWVKVFIIIFIILVTVFVILHLMGLGFGDHGGMGGMLPGIAHNIWSADLACYAPTIEHAVQQL